MAANDKHGRDSSLLMGLRRRVVLVLVVIGLAVAVLFAVAASRNDRSPDLTNALLQPSDLVDWDATDAETYSEPNACLYGTDEALSRTGSTIYASDRTLITGQYVALYHGEDGARAALALAQQTLSSCTAVTWRATPEQLEVPEWGMDSLGFIVSGTVNGVERDPPNRHLYAAFVRHSNLVGLVMFLTRDTSEFEAIATIADQRLADAAAALSQKDSR